MHTIIFEIDSVQSHYNASFTLAKLLYKQGYKIIYLSWENNYQELVEAQGFIYKNINQEYIYTNNTSSQNEYQPTLASLFLQQDVSSSRYTNIFMRRKNNKRNSERYLQILTGDTYRKIISDIKPSLCIIHTFLLNTAIVLHTLGVKVLIIQDKFSTCKAPDVPPLNSSIIPNKTIISRWTIELSWFIYFIKRAVKATISQYLFGKAGHRTLAKRIAQQTQFPLQSVADANRSFQLGLNNLPEILIHSRHLDFPREYKSNQLVAGPLIDIQRQESFYDWRFDQIINQIDELKKRNGYPLIYCALGSMSSSYETSLNSFYNKLIEIFTKNKNYLLVLAVGLDANINKYHSVPNNIFIFQNVPQIAILKRADVMITHGGTLSITECVKLAVPMIAFPLNLEWDHKGNTARVVYHKIGLKGSIKRDSVKQIFSKIKCLLSESSYRNNLKIMKDKFENEVDNSPVLKYIDTLI